MNVVYIVCAGTEDAHIEMLLRMLGYETTEAMSTVSTTPAILPFFEHLEAHTNVTSQLGSDVTLHCRVNDLTDQATVSIYSSEIFKQVSKTEQLFESTSVFDSHQEGMSRVCKTFRPRFDRFFFTILYKYCVWNK